MTLQFMYSALHYSLCTVYARLYSVWMCSVCTMHVHFMQVCSKCHTRKTPIKTVSIQVQLVSYKCQHGHKLINYQCQTQTRSHQLSISTQTKCHKLSMPNHWARSRQLSMSTQTQSHKLSMSTPTLSNKLSISNTDTIS